MATKPITRKRSNSVKEVLDELEPVSATDSSVASASSKARRTTKASAAAHPSSSLVTSWLVKPSQSAQIIAAVVALWAALEYTTVLGRRGNPLTPLIFISYPLTPTLAELGKDTHYDKGLLDLAFLGFYIVVFSFVRQSLTEYIIRPFARSLGIKSESKLVRFMEQAYAVVYFTASGSFGLVRLDQDAFVGWPGVGSRRAEPRSFVQYVMSKQDSWWYKTEHYWLQYPHWCVTTPAMSRCEERELTVASSCCPGEWTVPSRPTTSCNCAYRVGRVASYPSDSVVLHPSAPTGASRCSCSFFGA